MPTPVVLVSADVRAFDGADWHGVELTYMRPLVERIGVVPVILAAFGTRVDLDAVLDRVDGVLLTGSPSNVHPSHYGTEPTARHEPYDEKRDATNLPLIRRSVERGIPLLGICRGHQDINVAFGGTLETEIQELPGIDDHRMPKSEDDDVCYRLAHAVAVTPGGLLHRIVGKDRFEVNSLHRQAIARLGAALTVEARADDGVIEAIGIADAPSFMLGVQWHPEYWTMTDEPSGRIFDAFGAACRTAIAARK